MEQQDKEQAFLDELDRRGIEIREIPGTLRAGEVLSWIGSGLLMLFGIGLLIAVSVTKTEFELGIDSGIATGMGIGVLVQAVLQLIGCYYLNRGHNGGRITLTVIGAINILLNLFQLATGQVSVLIICVYVVLALALMWTRAGTEYLNSERQQRDVAKFVTRDER